MTTLIELTRTLAEYFRFGNVRIKDDSGDLSVVPGNDTGRTNVQLKDLILHSDPSDGAMRISVADFDPGDGEVPFVLPNEAGNPNDALSTDGSGNLFWQAMPVFHGVIALRCSFDVTTTTGSLVFVLPNGCNVLMIRVALNVAFDGPATISLGDSGDNQRYVATADVDLDDGELFDIPTDLPITGGAKSVYLYIDPSTATVGGGAITFEIQVA